MTGEAWMTHYMDMLEEEKKAQVVRSKGDTVLKFCVEKHLKSKEKVTIPCEIACEKCQVKTDVGQMSDILLLLGKPAMKTG